ncbi:MAG: exopolysaccharide biosynthesis protein [Planctomycetota bacterium]
MPDNITDVLDRLEEEFGDSETVELQDILDAFSGRLFGPLLFVPALIALSPIGAIPLVPTSLAVVLVLIAGQRLFGRDKPWLPRFLREREIDREKVENAFDKIRPWAKRIDRFLEPRLPALVEKPMSWVLTLLVLGFAVTMVPLEILPFAVVVPALGVALLALGLTARDGVLVIAGYVLAGCVIGLLIFAL